MRHPGLALYEIDEKSARGKLLLDDRSIPLTVESEDKTLEEALSLATIIASALLSYDQISKDVAASDLLESYNSGWNAYDQAQEDGSFKTVINPELSANEFKERLVLSSVSVSSDSCVEFWYEDGGMFWGHSVFVQSLDGEDFGSARAQLFG